MTAKAKPSFNSLQTGKCVASDSLRIRRVCVVVSIPFKRESV